MITEPLKSILEVATPAITTLVGWIGWAIKKEVSSQVADVKQDLKIHSAKDESNFDAVKDAQREVKEALHRIEVQGAMKS
jgi:hypothetical protein